MGWSAPKIKAFRRLFVVFALLVVGATALAACSSSKSSGGGTGTGTSSSGIAESGAPKPTGSPIKVMTVASVHYNGLSYGVFFTVAKLYEQYINAHGGIAGHPLEVTTCDDQGDPNTAAACARQAVTDHDVAVVGSFTLNGNSIVPILAAAKISWFGIPFAASSDEFTSPDVQVLGPGFAEDAGVAAKAGIDGCKKTAFVTYQTPTSAFDVKLVNNALKSVGAPQLKTTVYIPLTVQDYSSQVEQATNGTDCIIAGLGESSFPPFLTAFESAGGNQHLYALAGNLDSSVAKSFVAQTQNAVVAGGYGDLSTSAWADFRSAISQYNAPSNQDYNGSAALGCWAGYEAFAQIVKSMTAPITGPNFLATAQKAKVNLMGKVAPVNFSQKFTGLGSSFVNSVNRSVSFQIVNNGELVPFKSETFYDMTNALEGKSLPAADRPPAGS